MTFTIQNFVNGKQYLNIYIIQQTDQRDPQYAMKLAAVNQESQILYRS